MRVTNGKTTTRDVQMGGSCPENTILARGCSHSSPNANHQAAAAQALGPSAPPCAGSPPPAPEAGSTGCRTSPSAAATTSMWPSVSMRCGKIERRKELHVAISEHALWKEREKERTTPLGVEFRRDARDESPQVNLPLHPTAASNNKRRHKGKGFENGER